MSVVLDSSAILAALNGEDGAELVDRLIGDSFVSTVNIGELATVFAREGQDEKAVRTIIAGLPSIAVAPDRTMATDAGLMHLKTASAGLSLGDRFCLALARSLDKPVYTADRAWRAVGTSLGVEINLIR